ncbi:GIGYF family protein CG11148-like isoform X2 [Belonocnema kinseyi]|uniref:GIGYF family protein CG11148-like isoform X2 n=1 Tax=Belonocnema kinseyi TaxID=2817044 RepID=UPI00143D357C|nr:GIGYF family protein CG11148-like isoform X2 [Belonocnema kinseyi]
MTEIDTFFSDSADSFRMWNVGVTSATGRGRGGSVDRGGRGRTGRGGLYTSPYSRAVGFDEPGDGTRIDTQPFPGRGRPFDRSQSERGWSERNGIPEPGEWNGSTSPRKELTRGPSGGSLMESNWRRHRGGGEDDEGWRVASNNRGEKWGGKSSWRDGTLDKDRAEGEGEENRSGGRWDHRGNHRSSYDSHHPSSRSSRPWDPNHHDNHDNLPEWATENPSESGGSFDASGAFHGGMYSDEDEDGGTTGGGSQDSRTRSVSEGNTTNTPKQNTKSAPHNNNVIPGQPTVRQPYTATNSANKERPKSLHPFEEKDIPEDQERRSLSPVRIAPTPNNTPVKAHPPTPEANIRLENFPSRKPQEAPDDRDRERNSGRDSKPVENKKKENSEGNLNIDPAVISMSRHPPQKLPGFLTMNVNMNMANITANTARQKTDEDLDRMKEEADALVAKLMADEGSHRGEVVNLLPSDANPGPGLDSSSVLEKWFYRDPQGEVQGPFLASEMAEWWKQGYFQPNLLVRRTCDERFASLGDLMSICGRVPFKPGPAIPPLKSNGPVQNVPNTVPTGIPGSALPKTTIEDPMLFLQYQRMQLMQNQQMFLRQMAIAKLSQSDHWPSLSPVEQNQLILQYIGQETEIPEMPMSHNPFVPPLATPATNPVMQLFNQMQAKSQMENHMAPGGHPNAAQHSAPLGFLQQMIQERSARQNMPGMQPPPINSAPPPMSEDNPIKSLLRQLNVHANGHPQVPVESVWPQPPPHITPPFNAQSWLAQVGPIPAMPPGQIPNSLWDIHGKDIKTEQQILEEQNLRLQEDKKKEELKKLEELKRQEDELLLKRQQEEYEKQTEALKRHLEEKRRIEEEKKRKEEEKRKQEEDLKKKEEEKRRKEEERRKEEKRKLDEELNKKKQEEEKKRKEEAKRQEEKLRKEEEKRKKLEEEQKRQEEEKRRKEEQAARKAEAEEQARKAEQRRREEEALRKLQERSKAPWAQATQAAPPVAQASLADIQRLEREKKAEQLRYQQMLQLQLAHQKAQEAAQEAVAADSSKRLQFKWAEKTAGSNKQPQVKSLAQIQQEEQERIAKEREKQEKTSQKESAVALQNAGIWGTASQSLTWASSGNAGSQGWAGGSSAGGFWDDPSPTKANSGSKQANKQTPSKMAAAQPQLPQVNNKTTKNKTKREEELVKKLFEQNTAKPDDFTQWCNKALAGLQVSVDIPTFIGFLRDIESPYEVKEYVRLYLGDDRLCMDFAKQFLEKRSKWRSSQRPQAQADDLCKPAPAINPNAATEFQEVKGKAKKPKKGKMFKVDSRILGFSVTSAPDRINVGDRDYGEGF